MKLPQQSFVRLARLAGISGPLILGGTIAVLTVLERQTLRTLGWHPLRAPTTDWPSGLALGPLGNWMIAAFVISGSLLVVFAIGLHKALPSGSALGPALLVVSGLALALLAAPTDPTYLPTPRTFAGAVHDAAFALLGLSLLPALLILPRRMRQSSEWRAHAKVTLTTAGVLVPCFLLRGVFFYAFLVCAFGWFALTAVRIRS